MLVGHGHFSRVFATRWVKAPVTAGRWLDLDTATVSHLGWPAKFPCYGSGTSRSWLESRLRGGRCLRRSRSLPPVLRALRSPRGLGVPPVRAAHLPGLHARGPGGLAVHVVRQGGGTCVTDRSVASEDPGPPRNTRLTPVVTALIVVNAAIYLWELTNFNNIVSRFGMWPYGVYHYHQYYRLFTAAFLHASFWHIAFNMITLAIIGSPVEAEVGKARFTTIYLLSALGGSVASYLLSDQNQLGVGASGAIFGLFGRDTS